MAETARHPTVFDTGRQHLGQVYAKALLGAAGTKELEATLAELDAVVDLLDQLPQLDAALASPRIPHEDKEKILDSAFEKRLSKVLLTFFKVVSRHGRLNCLRAIQHAAHELYNKACGRVEVRVRAASALDEKTLQHLTQTLKTALGADVVIHAQVDGSLIGGVVIQIGDTVYDGSLANRLVRLREESINNTAQIIRETIERFTLAD